MNTRSYASPEPGCNVSSSSRKRAVAAACASASVAYSPGSGYHAPSAGGQSRHTSNQSKPRSLPGAPLVSLTLCSFRYAERRLFGGSATATVGGVTYLCRMLAIKV